MQILFNYARKREKTATTERERTKERAMRLNVSLQIHERNSERTTERQLTANEHRNRTAPGMELMLNLAHIFQYFYFALICFVLLIFILTFGFKLLLNAVLHF